MKTVMNFLIDMAFMVGFMILFLVATVWLLLVAPGNNVTVAAVMEVFTALILWVVGLIGSCIGLDCVVSYIFIK